METGEMEPKRAPAALVAVLKGCGEVSGKQSKKEETQGQDKESRP